jgi:hypothetical protein
VALDVRCAVEGICRATACGFVFFVFFLVFPFSDSGFMPPD